MAIYQWRLEKNFNGLIRNNVAEEIYINKVKWVFLGNYSLSQIKVLWLPTTILWRHHNHHKPLILSLTADTAIYFKALYDIIDEPIIGRTRRPESGNITSRSIRPEPYAIAFAAVARSRAITGNSGRYFIASHYNEKSTIAIINHWFKFRCYTGYHWYKTRVFRLDVLYLSQ